MMANSLSLKIAAAVLGLGVVGGAAYYVTVARDDAAPADGTPAVDERSDSEVDEGTEVVLDVDALAELEAFGSAYGNVQAKVRYAFTSTGTDGDTESGEMTQYWMPGGDRWRVDSEFDGVTGIAIHDGGTIYSCMPSEQQCYSIGAGADAESEGSVFMEPTEIRDEVEDVDDASTVTMSRRTIVGRAASCFHVRDESGDESTFCFDNATKVMLLMEASSDGTTSRMEALEVTTDVSAADFAPPYPVLDFNAMMGGFELPEGMEVPEGFMAP